MIVGVDLSDGDVIDGLCVGVAGMINLAAAIVGAMMRAGKP